MRFSPIRVGLVLGVLAGLWHAAWAGLVALGLAQKLMDFILYIHFISLPLTIAPFEAQRAGILVGFTFLVWFIAGVFAAWIWNLMHPRAAA